MVEHSPVWSWDWGRRSEGTDGLQPEVVTCLSEGEEHIPGCSFPEESWVKERGWKGSKRQERTFGCSCPYLVCWFPGTPAIVGSCARRFVAAREHCCPCEGGSRRQALEGSAEQTTAAVTKIGQR